MKSMRLLCAAACLLPAACATPGGGPFGMVMFDPDQHVSAAEPLFGKNDLQCLDNPAFTLSIYKGIQKGSETLPSDAPAICAQIINTLRLPLADSGYFYTKRQRNEVINALMASSDRRCGRYIAFLQQYDGNVNSTFGISSQAAATIAALATGGTAQAFAGAAAILGGARGTLNQSHFQNQTIGVIANAFETKRGTQREAIAKLQDLEVEKYDIQRALQDAFRYHSTCSIASGLTEVDKAVQEWRSPSNATLDKILDQMKSADAKMRAYLAQRSGTQTPAPPAPGAIPTTGTAAPIP